MSYYGKKNRIDIQYKGRCSNCGQKHFTPFKNQTVRCCLEKVKCDYAVDYYDTDLGNKVAYFVNLGYALKESWAKAKKALPGLKEIEK